MVIPAATVAAASQPAASKSEPISKSEPMPKRSEVSAKTEVPSTPPPWQAKKPVKRPSWLQVNAPRRPQPAPNAAAETGGTAPTMTEQEAPAEPAQPEPKSSESESSESKQSKPAPKPAATGLLDRLRQEFAEEARELSAGQKSAKQQKRNRGLLDRFRRADAKEDGENGAVRKARSKSTSRGMNMATLSPNDLRHYLTQRIATSDVNEETGVPSKPKIGGAPVGPTVKSLDTVLDKVLESVTGGLPRALLVAGTSAKADATHTAIELARALVDLNEQVVLVDLAKGASAVSGPLGMPRVPGFADLATGRATFGDVVRVDDETPLQVITAGNPAMRGEEPEPDQFMPVFEALTQAYDCIVLHADLGAVKALMPALKFELPVMVAVLPTRVSAQSEDEALSTFQALGCPVVVYEPRGRPNRRRSGLFSRPAAV